MPKTVVKYNQGDDMARPTKCRRLCRFPEILEFSPIGDVHGPPIVMTMDEFETIRLIDKEGLSQEECGAQLEVGRTTAQRIYDTARKKLAEALVSGRTIKFSGGDFLLCNGDADFCYKKECKIKKIQTEYKMKKGEFIMRIAVAYENGSIFQHFGHTEQFKTYDVEDGKIVKTEIVNTDGAGHGALAGVLMALNADVLICGGIGAGAKMALSEAGIELYGGVCGNADEAVCDFIEGKLDFNPDVRCSHHDHEHGKETHTCGEHVCGGGHCNH